MITLAIAILSFSQMPKTFEELEIAKIEAYHQLKGFREEVEVETPNSPFRRVTLKDGDRIYVSIVAGTFSPVETFNNGKKVVSITPYDNSYYENPFSKPTDYKAKDYLLTAEPETCSFKLVSGQPVQFASDRPLKLQPIETVTEDGEKLRKVTALGTSTTGGKITVTQWFLPDKWLIKKMKVVTDVEDSTTTIDVKVTKLSFNEVFENSQFEVKPEALKGLTKKDPPKVGS